MIAKWLRESNVAAMLLVVIRVYAGWVWAKAGWEKLTSDFDLAAIFNTFLANPAMSPQGELVYPTFNWFLENIALPNAGLFAVIVPLGQLLVGLGLILGGLTSWAAFFAIVMNMSFLFANQLSVNPWYICFEIPVMFAGYNAGKYGLDYYIYPLIRKLFKKDKGSSSVAA